MAPPLQSFLQKQGGHLKSRILKVFSIQLLILVLSLISMRVQAAQKIDPTWVRSVGQNICTPSFAPDIKGCEAEYQACTAEIEDLMDRLMNVYCGEVKTDLCETISYRVVEFSSKGINSIVLPKIDYFMMHDDSLKQVRACVLQRKNQEVFSDKIKDHGLIFQNTGGNVFASEFSNARAHEIDSVFPAGHDMPVNPTTPGQVEEVIEIPVQAPVQEQVPVIALEDRTEVGVAEKDVPRESPKHEVPVEPSSQDKPIIVQPEPSSVNSDSEFSGGACSLNTLGAPTHWAASLFAVLSLGVFVPGCFKRK